MFHNLGHVDYHNHCVLIVRYAVCHSQSSQAGVAVLLCSAATDGVIALWGDLGKLLLGWTEHRSGDDHLEDGAGVELGQGKSDCFASPLLSFHAHQSGIHDIAMMVKPAANNEGNELVLASVGDDNALIVSTLLVKYGEDCATQVVLLGKSSAIHAHHSSITGQQECLVLLSIHVRSDPLGVQFLSASHLVSTAVDHRLTVWHMSTALPWAVDSLNLQRVGAILHDVADASCLLAQQQGCVHWLGKDLNINTFVFLFSTECLAVVCGIGMELVHFRFT